jgi:hypothetical protein
LSPPSHTPSPCIHIHRSRILFKNVSGYIPPFLDITTAKTVTPTSKRKLPYVPPYPAVRRPLSNALNAVVSFPLQPIRSLPCPMESLKYGNSSFKMGATFPLICRLGSNQKLPVSQVTNNNKLFVLFHQFSIQSERIAGNTGGRTAKYVSTI